MPGSLTQSVRAELYNDAISIPSYVDAKVLAAGVAETFTVPANAYFVVFSGNAALADYYVAYTGTAAAPAGDVSDGSASFPNIGYAWVTPGQTISAISPTGGILCAAYFRRPT